jgi:hypothetical protein
LNHYNGGSSYDGRQYNASDVGGDALFDLQTAQTKTCVAEGRERPIDSFIKVTRRCTHENFDCRDCVDSHVDQQLQHRGWNDMRCRTCGKGIKLADMVRLKREGHLGTGTMDRFVSIA